MILSNMKATFAMMAVETLLLVGLCGILPAKSPQAGETLQNKPKLLLFLIVDQARYEYWVRFRPALKGGFKLLLERGVSFTTAHHRHALTSTGPGHASLSTGHYPGHSGIIANQWYDRETRQILYCVSDPRSPIIPVGEGPVEEGPEEDSQLVSGRSPRNLLVTTLADWMKRQNPNSRVFAASRKDRSAVPMGGKNADAVFWFDPKYGNFVTSRYYLKDYPDWIKQFHARKIPDSHFAKPWEALPVATSVYRTLEIEAIDRGAFKGGFPYSLGGLSLFPDAVFYNDFAGSPYMDLYLVQFAKSLIENESLGSDDDIDFLGLSFSALDSVGHNYGPNSPEILDTFLRLDLMLGDLLKYVDQRIGLEHVVIALSADHGVMPLPEYLALKKQPGERIGVEEILCFQSIGKKLEAKFGRDEWLLHGLYLDYETLDRHNLLRQDVEHELARFIEHCPSVAKVWTRTELESPPANSPPQLQLFVNSFHPKRSADLFVQLRKFYLNSRGEGTSHGTPYGYDTHVPLFLVVPGAPARKIPDPVFTVDLAPTLAALLDIAPPENLDGVDRTSLLGEGSSD